MRRLTSLLPLALVLASLATTAFAVELKTEDDKTVYTMGVMLSQRLKPMNMSPAEVDLVVEGLRDSLLNNTLKADTEVYKQRFVDFQKARMAVVAQAEKAKAAEYCAKVAKEPGVQKFDSGLLYKDLTVGTGASPTATDQVKVHYTGTLTDGTKFDSSVDRGQPVTFPLNGVIACWTEGVQKMKVGGKARLVCPSDIAYGDNGRPPQIPGGATLVFDVELLDIVK